MVNKHNNVTLYVRTINGGWPEVWDPKCQDETHPDSFHHEADVTYALEVRALVNGVNSLYVAGDLQGVQDFRLAVTQVQQWKKQWIIRFKIKK